MIPVHQTIFGGVAPDVVRVQGMKLGNCLQACMASLYELGIGDVPHFAEAADWWGAMQKWTFEHSDGRDQLIGLQPLFPAIRLDQLRDDGERARSRYVIASGPSPRGDFLHALIADSQTGEIVHDPHPGGGGFAGPVVDVIAILPAWADCSWEATR